MVGGGGGSSSGLARVAAAVVGPPPRDRLELRLFAPCARSAAMVEGAVAPARAKAMAASNSAPRSAHSSMLPSRSLQMLRRDGRNDTTPSDDEPEMRRDGPPPLMPLRRAESAPTDSPAPDSSVPRRDDRVPVSGGGAGTGRGGSADEAEAAAPAIGETAGAVPALLRGECTEVRRVEPLPTAPSPPAGTAACCSMA